MKRSKTAKLEKRRQIVSASADKTIVFWDEDFKVKKVLHSKSEY